MSQIFEKYESLIGKPNGRPAGVRNGQGATPQKPSNPMFDGMKHSVEGIRDTLLGDTSGTGMVPTKTTHPKQNQIPNLVGAQKKAMKQQEFAMRDQTSVQKEIENLNEWLRMFK